MNCRKGKLTLSLVASLMRLISTYQNTIWIVFSVFLTEKNSIFTSFVIANMGQKGLCFLILSGGIRAQGERSVLSAQWNRFPSLVCDF